MGSAESRRAQAGALRWLAAILAPGLEPPEVPWHELTVGAVAAARARLAAERAPASARRALSALRGVLRESWRLGLLTADERDRLSDVAPVPGSRLPAGRGLTESDIAALLATGSTRDRALLATLVYGGLRRQELAFLRQSDLACQPDPPLVRLNVVGKGGKQRICYIAGEPARAVLAHVAGGADPVFGLATGGAVWKRVTRLAARAGLGHVSPHDLRRTFTGLSLARGVDLATVQRAMGHADPRTTARYDRRSEDALVEAAHALVRP